MIFLRVDLNSFLNVKTSKTKIQKPVTKYQQKDRSERMNICLRNPFVRIIIIFFSVNLFKILRTFSNFHLLFSLTNKMRRSFEKIEEKLLEKQETSNKRIPIFFE